jgi:alkanesulfonate monooxygenase SsuD/methylene tetrahydromethanopterin reductase-like flavin-dependent oxidoreductase (luciferase family)
MNLGLYFDLRNPPPFRQDWGRLYAFTLEVCEEAERLGADSLWVTEHHLFEDGYLPQPLTFAAALAARTRSARIGTAILIAPLYHPVHLAEQAAIVDIVSGGRLDLGIGAGYRIPEFELFDADVRARGRVTLERAEQLRRIWAEGRVTPLPLQGRLPIWVGCATEAAARRTGELGEGLLSIDARLVEPYREGLLRGEHDPGSPRIAGPMNVFLSDDPERDWQRVGPHVGYQWDSYARYRVEGTDRPSPPPIDIDEWRRRGLTRSAVGSGFLFGTPEQAAAAVRACVGDVPVETVFVWGSVAGTDEDLVCRNVELACTRLAPLLAG